MVGAMSFRPELKKIKYNFEQRDKLYFIFFNGAEESLLGRE